MKRACYQDSISNFIKTPKSEIIGILSKESINYQLLKTQTESWNVEIEILKKTLADFEGSIFFEYEIPRMGRKIDVVVIIRHIVFVLEFKVGEKEFPTHAIDQVHDYALDLKNFHEGSHSCLIAPILISTEAILSFSEITLSQNDISKDRILKPVNANREIVREVIKGILDFTTGSNIEIEDWVKGRYSPTPTIIEAAISLFNSHSVADITRTDASATNLSETSRVVSNIISKAKENKEHAICFVTGVPGAGKTLVGLNVATKHLDKNKSETSVFLSGNGPLVAILCEALTRDRVAREKELGKKIKKGEVLSQVKMFIQNVHHFRDEYLKDQTPPKDHVAIFDEAQRAWDIAQTTSFMTKKRNLRDFTKSEPEFLISCLDRHQDWAVIVCLVGGGQEIHTGEAGIMEWIESINRSFSKWKVYISSNLQEDVYNAKKVISQINKSKLEVSEKLHLSVSMRSFRAEHLSTFIAHTLDLRVKEAKREYEILKHTYPIAITRDIEKAKRWLKDKARGTERFGIVVSSQAQRLKPLAIDIRVKTDPIHWFLNGKHDTRSSYYLEDVATEFQVQGLELDWVCVAWDGDFQYSKQGWKNYSFKGNKWQNIKKEERKQYLKNAYRVLLTRARQGMIILIPEGNTEDHTRLPKFYDHTYSYLKSLGIEEI